MTSKLAGKLAVVTRGSAGIAGHFADEGVRVSSRAVINPSSIVVP